MATPATIPGALQKGDHTSRPAAGDVSAGTLYSCTTHPLIYQSDGTTWTTWASISGGGGSATLAGLTDVNIGTPTNGQVLTYDSTPGEWVAAAPTGGGPADLDDLTDVNAPAPADGQVLTWDSTPGEWKPAAPAGGVAPQLDDVLVSGSETGNNSGAGYGLIKGGAGNDVIVSGGVSPLTVDGSVRAFEHNGSFGGAAQLVGGDGLTTFAGGEASIVGGDGASGGLGATVRAHPGSAAAHGKVEILSGNSTGTAGQVLTADGVGKAGWAAAAGGSALTVEEVDGSPTNAAVTKLVFPNDSLSIAGTVATVRQAPVGFIGVKAYRTTTQAAPTAVGTAMGFDAEEFDTDGFHDNSTNNTRLTVPAGLGGKYLAVGSAAFATGTEAYNWVTIRKNGTTLVAIQADKDNSVNDLPLNLSVPLDLVPGDYLELVVFHGLGSTVTIYANGTYPLFLSLLKLDAGRVGSGVGAKAYNSAAQTINNTTASLALDSEAWDTDGFHSTTTNTERMTVPAGLGGKYLIVWRTHVPEDVTATSKQVVGWLRKNGSASVRGSAAGFNQTATAQTEQSADFGMTVVEDLAAGDYIDVQFFTTANMAVGHATAEYGTTLSIMRLDSGAGSGSGGGSALTVEEVDGSPTMAAVTKIVFPNDSVSIAGSVATIRQAPVGMIGCSVGSASQSVTGATFTAVAFASESFDTDGFHSTSSNTSRLTIPAGLGGKYLITATLGVLGSSTEMILIISKNGAGSVGGGSWLHRVVSGASDAEVSGSIVLDLVAGDYIEMYCYLGATRTLSSFSRMEIVKLDAGRVGSGIGASLTLSADQVITTGTATAVTFGASTELFDTDGFHDTGSNTSRLTIPAGLGGKYIVGWDLERGTPGSGKRWQTYVRKNGSDVSAFNYGVGDASGLDLNTGQSVVHDLVAGDYLELVVHHDAGSNRTLWARAGSPMFWIMRLDTTAGERPDKASAGSSADTALVADTIADVTGCSVSLAAGNWLVWAAYTIDTGSAVYTLGQITDSANNPVSVGRNIRNTGTPVTTPIPPVLVSPSVATTYKLRCQAGATATVLRYGLSTVPGTTLVAVRVA